jgi:ribosomal protein S25
MVQMEREIEKNVRRERRISSSESADKHALARIKIRSLTETGIFIFFTPSSRLSNGRKG